MYFTLSVFEKEKERDIFCELTKIKRFTITILQLHDRSELPELSI